MYIPQQIFAAGMLLTGFFKQREVLSGSILDFAVEKCIDGDGHQRCSKPYLVQKGKNYRIEWTTDGAISHTTAEFRDAGSDEIVFYRDTDGDWTPDKGELIYLDFKPKIAGQANKTVDFTLYKGKD